MTVTSQLIIDAFRQSNLIALGVTPTQAQTGEALRYLNRLVKSVFGNEAGDPLTSFPIGSKNINRPSGYPWWNTVPDNDWFVPENTRVMLNLDQKDVKLYLHPAPNDGSRFAAVDASGDLSEYPIAIWGNGNFIEGTEMVTLNEDNLTAEWFYRADLGNWVKSAPLDAVGVFPFPEEFDDFFITMLAIRLNPSYGAALDEQSRLVLNRSRSQLRSRYDQDIMVRSELALIRPARVAADRDQWGNNYWLYQPNAMFDKGWPL